MTTVTPRTVRNPKFWDHAPPFPDADQFRAMRDAGVAEPEATDNLDLDPIVAKRAAAIRGRRVTKNGDRPKGTSGNIDWPSNPFWFRTFTGRQFYLPAPRPADVDIQDIATALSRIQRFGGHCKVPYTVAEHSLHVAQIRPTLAALLHDASEAYIGDMLTPLKRAIPQFARIEEAIHDAIAERFGVDFSDPEIKRADMLALATERRDLIDGTLSPWSDLPKPLAARIRPHRSEQWSRKVFLERFAELGGE